MNRPLFWLILVGAIVALVWVILSKPSGHKESVPEAIAPPPRPTALPSLKSNLQALSLANAIDAKDSEATRDVMALYEILTIYQKALGDRQGTPIGNDTDLARALTGTNPMHQVFLPPGHPALAVKGHLVDRWGTPFYLHPRGHKAFEIRSAGPDRTMFTPDDLVANPDPSVGPQH